MLPCFRSMDLVGKCTEPSTCSAVQIPGLAEEEARYIFQQVLVAMDYCHRLGIANRDIKVQLPALILS